MASKLIVSPEARQETLDAADRGEQERPGRGRKLAAHIRECFQAVCRTPRAFTPLRPPYRRAVVKGFRYIVLYHYDSGTDTVTIDKVFHASRDPDDMYEGLP